jgi:hypothetical protein
MDSIRTFHVQKKLWRVYEDMGVVLDGKIEDAEDALDGAKDGQEFADHLQTWIVLKFYRTKYEYQHALAEVSFRLPAKAHGHMEAKGLLGWFGVALKMIDFCEAVGGLECTLSKEEAEMVSDEEEEEEEEEQDDDDMSDGDESENCPPSPDSDDEE